MIHDDLQLAELILYLEFYFLKLSLLLPDMFAVSTEINAHIIMVDTCDQGNINAFIYMNENPLSLFNTPPSDECSVKGLYFLFVMKCRPSILPDVPFRSSPRLQCQ